MQECTTVVKEACGPVSEVSCDLLFAGAVRRSNNVVELSAALELGWWVLGNHRQLRSQGNLSLLVHLGSPYTLRLQQHLFEPKANVTLGSLHYLSGIQFAPWKTPQWSLYG